MPQPLSRIHTTANVEIGNVGTRPLASRPHIAIAVAEAIAAWSHVESFMLRTYVNLAGGDDADAATIYLALETQSAKTAAVEALARKKLDPKLHQMLNIVLKVAKSAQKDRDKLAHWVWGTLSGHADEILMADPRDLIILNQDMRLNEDKIFVYRLDEFVKMRILFERIAGWGMSIRFLFGSPDLLTDELYAQLCQEPEIAEKLDRQAMRG